jgi:GT2 family glycosyltransferase
MIPASHKRVLPPASLIISSRNRPALLSDAVESVLRSNCIPAEIVIIDQSDEPHPELGRRASHQGCAIRYRWTQSVGVSRARNTGIRTARHDLVAFMDDDMLVGEDWFCWLIDSLIQGGSRAVVTGQVAMTESESPAAFAPSVKVHKTREVYQGRIHRDVLYTGNMAIHRSVIDTVGTFDERLGPGTRFPAAEDNDFGFRILEAGYRIIYEPNALVYHRAWRTDGHRLSMRWTYGVGRGAYYAKHLGLRDRFMLWRMMNDIGSHVRSFLSRTRKEKRIAYGEITLALGILVGAMGWMIDGHRFTCKLQTDRPVDSTELNGRGK